MFNVTEIFIQSRFWMICSVDADFSQISCIFITLFSKHVFANFHI